MSRMGRFETFYFRFDHLNLPLYSPPNIESSHRRLRTFLDPRFDHLSTPPPHFSLITLTLRRFHCMWLFFRPLCACYIVLQLYTLISWVLLNLAVISRTNPWVSFIFSMSSGVYLSTWQNPIVCLHSGAIYNSYQRYNETAYVKLTSWSTFVEMCLHIILNLLKRKYFRK